MVAIKFAENTVYRAVEAGELEIDKLGRIWRVASRRADRWSGGTRVTKCVRRRAEHSLPLGYLQVRVMFDGIRIHALAHRLVYRHVFGPIPDGMTVNHKNGQKMDNRSENLSLATTAEQTKHSLAILKRGRLNQYGQRNSMAKLTVQQVVEIRHRRMSGESLNILAAEFGVAFQTISKIARGDRRSLG